MHSPFYFILDEVDEKASLLHRSIIGWFSYELTRKLELEEKEAYYYFLPFAPSQEIKKSKDEEMIHYLANLAVEHIKEERTSWDMDAFPEVDEALRPAYAETLRQFLSLFPKVDCPFEAEKKVWSIYRDVIFSATAGKLLLIERDEVCRYTNGQLLADMDVAHEKDVATARDRATAIFSDIETDHLTLYKFKLAVSEAVTNMVKHGKRGTMKIYHDQKWLRIVCGDIGNGFTLKELPHSTLMSGFSTKQSLGQGYKVMLKMVQELALETSNQGTTLVLTFGLPNRLFHINTSY